MDSSNHTDDQLLNIFDKGKITTLEDFEKHFNVEWPIIPDDIEMPNFNIEEIFGSLDDVSKMLEPEAMKKSSLFDEMDKRIENIEKYINYYKSEIFSDDEKRVSKIKQNRFFAPDKSDDENENSFFMTETDLLNKPNEGKILSSAHRRRRKLLNDNQKKRLENVLYVGFTQNELTDLPGFLEPPQILNSVTSSMEFTPSFLRFWSPIIRSEASNAILLDSFWWFYLHYFKNDKSLEDDKSLYFSRIADSFVALFMSVDSTMRDKFFNLYPNFLSQAIYLTFYKAFADSRLQFNDEFKQNLCDTINEWILGVKPIPESYKEWKTVIDSNSTITNSDGRVVSTVELMQKIGNLEKMLKTLGNDDEQSKPNTSLVNKSASFIRKGEKITYRENADEILASFYEKKHKKSHAVGESVVIEKVLFNLRGQSMLISHYLSMHNLQETEPQGHKVTRSQISQIVPETAPTYKDVIYESLERTKTLELQFEKISKQTEDEIKKIEKSRKQILLESEKSNGSLKNKKNKKTINDTTKKPIIQINDEKITSKDFDDTIENFDDIPYGDE